MKAGKVIRNVVLGLLGLVLVLLIVLQIVLRPKVLTGIVNHIADDYVEGEVGFRSVKAHVIKSFPFLNIEAEDFVITYPHERFAAYDDSLAVQGGGRRRFNLLTAGTQPGGGTDTLASFSRLSVSVNYMAFLRQDKIHVHLAELEHPRIFAHYYDSTAANWDILPLNQEKDTTEKEKKPLPDIRVDRLALTDRPFIVFTNPVDTLQGLFTMRRMELNGRLNTEDLPATHGSLRIDSLLISGRVPRDTVSLRLESLHASARHRNFHLDAQALVRLRTGQWGRMQIPVGLALDATLPREERALRAQIHSLCLDVSSLRLQGGGEVCKNADSTLFVDVTAAIKDCPLGKMIDEFEENFPVLKKVETDAVVSLDASAKGTYGKGEMPAVNARLQVPASLLDYEGLSRKGRLALDVALSTDERKRLNADVDRLLVDIAGARVKASGAVQDALGKDPLIDLNGDVHARVDSLIAVFVKNMDGTGSIDAKLQGRARLSQLDMVHIGAANINCDLVARDLSLEVPADNIRAFIPQVDVNLATKGNTLDRNIPEGARVLALRAEVDTLNATYGEMFIRGGGVRLLAQNSADILKGGKELTPLMGLLQVKSLRMRDQDSLSLWLRNSAERFRITPSTQENPIPRLSLVSNNGSLLARSKAGNVAVRNAKLSFGATRRRRPERASSASRTRRLDSLQRLYPTVSRDSLLLHDRRMRAQRTPQDEFADKDINISISGAIRNYLRDWALNGDMNLNSVRIRMPFFPLPTKLSSVTGSFGNDTLKLKNLTVQAGASDLSASAQLTGLQRAVMGRGRQRFKLTADVTSNFIDANELLYAYAYYSQYSPKDDALHEMTEEMDDLAEEEFVLPEDDVAGRKMIVIPSNLEVDFSLEASGIKYDSLLVNWAAADVAMRDRTLQVTNALAASNMGDIFFEGFYSTHSKSEMKGGFDLNLVDITAEKVITLFPAVDTLMPMLKSFSGDLDCELAVTSDIDTCMNLVLPSVDGVMKISGKDLVLKENDALTKLAWLLMFKDKKKAVVDNMSVTGMVRDNVLEVYPFVLNVDRYILAASGIQHLNQDFRYHLSVIRSPLIVKFGVNAWGNDFRDIHYGLGKPLYRSVNVPVYTKELDNVQYNLVASIHNIFDMGVEKAIAENRAQEHISTESLYEDEELVEGGELPENLGALTPLTEDVVDRVDRHRAELKEEILQMAEDLSKSDE